MKKEKTTILDIIKSRRSTRRFKDDDVSDEDLKAILEAARWAVEIYRNKR